MILKVNVFLTLNKRRANKALHTDRTGRPQIKPGVAIRGCFDSVLTALQKGELPIDSHFAKVVAIETKANPFSAFCSTAMCC